MRAAKYLLIGLLTLLACTVSVAEDEEAAEGGKAKMATQYLDLKPSFVVNYGGPGKLRYLKTDITLRVGGGIEGGQRYSSPYALCAPCVGAFVEQSERRRYFLDGGARVTATEFPGKSPRGVNR